jgi:hypothetical protein
MRRRIEEAMEDAIHPTGMSVHNGKANVRVSDLHRMLLVIDSAPPRKEWVGLTDDEIDQIAAEVCFGYIDVARAIEAKLKEKNT